MNGALPENGADPAALLETAARLIADHSLFNGHPRFFGYITSSPAPIGMLADFLASALNPNVGGWLLSPAATEVEAQTIRWIAELIGYPADCGGLLVSGGNMANFVCFLAARTARATWDVRAEGIAPECGRTFAATRRPRPTRGSRKPRISQESEPRAFAGFQPTAGSEWMWRSWPNVSRRTSGGRSAVHRGGDRGIGQHRRGRSAPRDRIAVPGAGRLVPRGRCLRRIRRCGAGCPSRPAGAGGRGFGGRRSAQVALRSARSGVCAGARPGSLARRLLVSPAVLPLRRAGHQLRGLRSAELAGLSRPESVAGAPAGGRVRLPPDDRRRYRALARHGGCRARASRARTGHPGPQHHDLPLRSCRFARK